MNKKAVSLFINTMGNGGAQRQLALLALELVEANYDVRVVHYGVNGFHVDKLLERGVKVINIGSSGLFRLVRIAIAASRIFRDSESGTVVSYLDSPNLICGLSKLMGSKFVWIASERSVTSEKTWVARNWRRWFYRYANYVVCNSKTQASWIRSLCTSLSVQTIHNGLPENFFSDRSKFYRRDKLKFIVLARLGLQKNPELLVDAVRLLAQESVAEFHIDWYGDDDPSAPGMRECLIDQAQRYGLPISFHFAKPHVENILDQSDCLILTSRVEGMPNVIIEAMARGVPCIASAVSDVPDILANGSRGWLFKPGCESGLATALKDFIASSEDRVHQVSSNAYEYARSSYSSKRMANLYMALLE